MRVAVLGILVSLSIAAATAEGIHGGSLNTKILSWKEQNHYFLRHGIEQEKEAVASPGLLSNQTPDSSRALTWALKEGQRSKNTRSSRSSSSGSSSSDGSSLDGSSVSGSPTIAKATKKLSKETKKEIDYHELVRQFRKDVRKWRRKKIRKAERKGKKPKIEYYKDSGIFDVKIPLFSERNILGYNLINQKRLKKDLTRAGLFKVNRVVGQNDKQRLSYDREPDIAVIPPPQFAMPESSPQEAGNVNDYETNTVKENVDEGGKQECGSPLPCFVPTHLQN